MSLCPQCLSISLSTLTPKEGHLHSDYPSLKHSALTCKLCDLFHRQLQDVMQKDREYTSAASTTAAPLFKDLPMDPKAMVSLVYQRPRDAEDLAADKEGTPRRIRRKPTEFSDLDVRLGHLDGGKWRSDVQASLLIYVHPGDPLGELGLQERTPLAENPLDDSVMVKVKGWVRECAEKHVECRRDQGRRAVRPKRLLFLQNAAEKGIMTIKDIPSDFADNYVTLSYCWGPTRDQTWLDYVSDIQSQRRSVEMSRMPKTLRDAVEVSLGLGYSYLWIDCLCIIQGDAEDWRTESAKMSGIYEGAAITISASDSADCRDGFLAPRDAVHRNGITLDLSMDDGRIGTLRIAVHELPNSFAATVRRGPVAKRAWCLQERRLTWRGVLHMCRNQTVFECVKSRHFESEVEASDDFVEDEFQLFHIPRDDSAALSRGKPSGNVSNVLQWYGIVEDYMTRNLTMASDKLVAIAGLAETANRTIQSRYLAGLWERQVHVGLCWTITENERGALRRCAEYRAPSWSWASVDGPVSWLIDGWVQSEDGFLESNIELLDAAVDVDKESPFGQVREGVLTVSGRLKLISADVLQENEILTYPKWMSGVTPYVGYYMEDEKRTLTGELYCLRVALRPFGPGPSIPPTNCMLVLEPKREDTFVRLGYGQVMKPDFFDDAPMQTLRLV